MNYTVQCTDTISGQVGCFGYDVDEYLAADKPLQFKAITPIFPGLVELFNWAHENGVTFEHHVVNWKPHA